MDGREPGMSGINEDVTREVERFLYREARLLDERRFHEWLELLTDDIHYWMGSRSNRYPRSSKAIAILDPDRYVEDDLAKEDELAILDETKQTLSQRVARLDTGMAWAEDPPSRSRHLITNIEVEPGDIASEVKTYSNFMVYRSRAETEQDFYVGARLRRSAARCGRLEDCRPPDHPRSERVAGEKRQPLLLSFSTAEIRCLFFDLGNTLVSEEAASTARLLQVACCFEKHGVGCSVEDIRQAYKEASAEFAPRLINAAMAKLTDDPKLRRAVETQSRYPKELEVLYEGAEEALRNLSARYRIGVIANQPLGTKERLIKWGLKPFVSICLASAELGIEKPDPAIFRLALSRAECAPHEAVMIGDRLDNDIRPAHLLGWNTIRVLQGFARFQSPRDQVDEPDATVARLLDLLPLFLPSPA
jgi:HAD superfamily hydrolase (TIGR01549 family)